MRNAMRNGFGMTIVAALLAASPALAEPSQCLGRGKAQWMLDSTLLGVVNPIGVEEQVRANACLPLIDRPGLLFDYTSFDAGLFSYVSPVFAHVGGYVSVSPLSFLVLRADAAAVGIWPLPMDGAGYFEVKGYRGMVTDAEMPAAKARSSSGANVTFTATLQGAVPLSPRLELEAADAFGADWWLVGDRPYYVNQRRDVVLARSDWLIKNTATLILAVQASRDVSVHLGAIDDLTWVPASNVAINQLTGFFSVFIRRDAQLRDIEPFVRAGAYTQRGDTRQGFTLMFGISLGWAVPVGGEKS